MFSYSSSTVWWISLTHTCTYIDSCIHLSNRYRNGINISEDFLTYYTNYIQVQVSVFLLFFYFLFFFLPSTTSKNSTLYLRKSVILGSVAVLGSAANRAWSTVDVSTLDLEKSTGTLPDGSIARRMPTVNIVRFLRFSSFFLPYFLVLRPCFWVSLDITMWGLKILAVNRGSGFSSGPCFLPGKKNFRQSEQIINSNGY